MCSNSIPYVDSHVPVICLTEPRRFFLVRSCESRYLCALVKIQCQYLREYSIGIVAPILKLASSITQMRAVGQVCNQRIEKTRLWLGGSDNSCKAAFVCQTQRAPCLESFLISSLASFPNLELQGSRRTMRKTGGGGGGGGRGGERQCRTSGS